jgi:2-polyprenyl-3-methyl-5-hydroxy-6-metoxy-1,4-benzoquinol methylase
MNKVSSITERVEIDGPFGPATQILALPSGDIVAAYRQKCGADIERWFDGIPMLQLFECRNTGYRFWRPASAAGDEAFYAYLSSVWPDYYRSERWEYPLVRDVVPRGARLLEIGCGRGYFLRSVEDKVGDAVGLEFNTEAIANKVTRCGVTNETIEQRAAREPQSFDMVCSFQVLEHVIDPHSFIQGCVACLRPGGVLALATPNHDSALLTNREDAFDMPPHHMGHFAPAVYRKIAALFDLDIAAIHVEKRYAVIDAPVTPVTAGRFSYRAARRLATVAMGLAYRLTNEPGNNILVLMKRRG